MNYPSAWSGGFRTLYSDRRDGDVFLPRVRTPQPADTGVTFLFTKKVPTSKLVQESGLLVVGKMLMDLVVYTTVV